MNNTRMRFSFTYTLQTIRMDQKLSECRCQCTQRIVVHQETMR